MGKRVALHWALQPLGARRGLQAPPKVARRLAMAARPQTPAREPQPRTSTTLNGRVGTPIRDMGPEPLNRQPGHLAGHPKPWLGPDQENILSG